MVDTVVEHVDAIARDGLRVTGPIDEFTVRVPAFTPQTLSGTWDAIVLATKAHHTGAAVRALLPHLAADGYVVSAQNGLNELAIAEVVGAERTVGAFVNFGADYLEPGVILYGGHGAVVVGEIDGRITPRVTALRDAWHHFDPRAIVTPNIWGYLWGKEAYGAMLFATALTNESIADALAMPAYRHLYIALAREMLAVAAARGVQPESFDGFDPAAYLTTAPAGAAEQLARCAGRAQPALGQVAQRHLARPRRPEAAHRGRRATRHRRHAGRRGWSADTAHRAPRGADSRDRTRRASAVARRSGCPCRRRFPHRHSMNLDFSWKDRHRHRRRARLRARDRDGVRRAWRTRLGVRRAR